MAICLTNLIPESFIASNIEASVSLLRKEGEYPRPFEWTNNGLDNFTDALMLLQDSYHGDESILERSLLMYRQQGVMEDGETMTPYETLLAYYDSLDEHIEFETVSYARYWHGYQVFQKMLFSLMDYHTFRVVNLVIQCILTAVICVFLWKKYKNLFMPYIVMWLTLNPLMTSMSLQYSNVFYVMTISTLILVLKNNKWIGTENHALYFLVVGIATSYFDLLTYPLVTLGVPLVLYWSMNSIVNIKKSILQIGEYSLNWCGGYAGMWGSKWILATLFTEQNVIRDAIDTVGVRTSMTNGAGNHISIIFIILKNIHNYAMNPLVVLAFFLFVFCFIIAWRAFLLESKRIVVFGLIAFFPLVWYSFASNHSYIHAFMTCKNLVIMCLAAYCCICTFNIKVKWKKLQI